MPVLDQIVNEEAPLISATTLSVECFDTLSLVLRHSLISTTELSVSATALLLYATIPLLRG